MADFLELPYVPAASRMPFRRHLFDRAVSVESGLATLGLIEARYAELSNQAVLRLPIFLALAIRSAREPDELWDRLASMREKAAKFRSHRGGRGTTQDDL
jgi:hypothetical protein